MSKFIFSTNHIDDTIHFNVPRSKSISQRFLVIKHMKSRNKTTIPLPEISDCEDVMLLEEHLRTIQRSSNAILDCKNSGATFRFLLAVCAVTKGNWTLTALPRMTSREIKPLVIILNHLGASVSEVNNGKFLMWNIEGKSKLSGISTPLVLPKLPSSQIVSALLLIGDFIENFKVEYNKKQTSIDYIKMTETLIENPYQEIERCWSSAAFAYCLMAIRQRGKVIIPELKPSTIQPDAIAEQLFRNMGVSTEFTKDAAILTFDPKLCIKRKFTIDVSQCLDLYLPLKVAAQARHYILTCTGVENLKYKETDRLSVVTRGTCIATGGDHRAVMSAAMIAFATGSVILDNRDCVKKSFPKFWENFL